MVIPGFIDPMMNDDYLEVWRDGVYSPVGAELPVATNHLRQELGLAATISISISISISITDIPLCGQ